MAYTYILNFIKIASIWIFRGGGRSPLLGGLHVTFDAHLRLGQTIPVKSHVWKFGLDRLSLSRVIWIFQEGRNPQLRGLHVTCDAHFRTWPSYSSQKSCVKIWLGLVEPFKSSRVHKHFSGGGGGINPLLVRVTFDLWCPFSNSDELFQSKVMWENLVCIGWNRRYGNVEEGGRPPLWGVTCDLWCPFSNLAELF